MTAAIATADASIITRGTRSRASLIGHHCSACHTGILRMHETAEFSADNGRLIVPLAFVNVCDGCKAEVVTEAEWQRWEGR